MKTQEEILNEIEMHKRIIPKIDGQRGFYKLGNRIYGAIGISLPLLLYYGTRSPLCLIGLPLVIDGVGDLVTGKHHFLLYKLTKSHPKDEIEKLEKLIDETKSLKE